MDSSGVWHNMMSVVGEGRSADYVEVLRGVRFVHRRPEDINTRTFRLTCIELRDHYASNQLAVQVRWMIDVREG